jgi:3-polyprenyl-4-hydroxybenzoate decarboxylase
MLSIRAGSLKKSHLNFIEKHLSSSSNRFLKIKVVLNGPCGENDSAAVAWGISHALMDRMQVDILQIRDTGILIARIDALMHVLSLFMTCRRTQCAIL